MQADGDRDLELDRNRGDGGDPYPGSEGNTAFDALSTPASKSYAGQPTCVAVTAISPSGATMTAKVVVRCAAGSRKPATPGTAKPKPKAKKPAARKRRV